MATEQFLFYQITPMAKFVIGEHRDIHGRKSLYKKYWRCSGNSNHVESWLKWVAYL